MTDIHRPDRNLAIKHRHPRDAFVRFDALEHTYTYTRQSPGHERRFTRSVSRVAGEYCQNAAFTFTASGADINRWIADPDVPAHDIAVVLNDAFGADSAAVYIHKLWERKRDCAAMCGRGHHRVVELILNGAPHATPELIDTVTKTLYGSRRDALFFTADELCLIPDEDTDAAAAVAWAVGRGFIPVRTEWSIYSLKHDIAGTIDAVFTVARSSNCAAAAQTRRVIAIVDWKFCAPRSFENNFKKYTLQLNLYLHILREDYNATFEPDGSPRDVFLFLVNIHEGRVDAREVEIYSDDIINSVLSSDKNTR